MRRFVETCVDEERADVVASADSLAMPVRLIYGRAAINIEVRFRK